MNKVKGIYFVFITMLLSGCVLTNQPIAAESDNILLYYHESRVAHCTPLGSVVGSEGHWYTFFFISNEELMSSAITDIKNKAHELGANSVVLPSPMAFNTSVTFLGSAYSCPLN